MLRFFQPAIPCLLFVLLIPFGGCTRDGDKAELSVVTHCAQLRRMPATKAREGHPVRLHGTVTFYDAEYRILTMQDESGGVFVDPREQDLDNVVPGMNADVEGYSAFEEFDPIVVKPKIRTGPRAMPPIPRRVAMSRLVEGEEDFQFVEVAGRLQSISFVNNIHLRFVLEEQNRTLEVIVSTQSPIPEWPAGTAVVVRGVASVLRDAQGNPRSARLHVSQFNDIQAAVLAESPVPPSAIPGPGLPLLTRVDQIKRLSTDEASKRYPVRVKGVLNFSNEKTQGLLVQDSTGGIYVTLRAASIPNALPGTQVEVEGVSHPGDFAPSIHQATVRVLSAGRLLPPLEIYAPDDLALSTENRWARIRGVARRTRTLPDIGIQIDLEVKGRHFPVDVVGAQRSERDSQWIDAELEIEGILGALFDENRSLQGFHLVVPAREFIKVTRPAPKNPFAAAAPPLSQLLEFRVDVDPRHRLKVAGTVTASMLSGRLYLSSGRASMRLQTSGASGAGVGDRVEAIGFLPLGAKLPVLEEAELRILRAGTPEEPVASNAEDLMSGATNTGLVRLEARLVDRRRSYGDEVLTLQAGKTRFTAVMEQPQPVSSLEALRPGSMLRLTGVCDMTWDSTRVPPEPIAFRLLLRSPADVTVLRLASWWTARNTFAVLSIVCALVVIVLAWVFILQRRVNSQTEMLAARLEHEKELQVQLARAHKLESVGRLAGGVAHDFNNLLTIVNGFSQLALARLGYGDPLRPQLEQIRRAGERAAVLTQQLLGFSRKQLIQPKPANLNALVAEAQNMLQPLLGEQVAIHTTLDPTLELVVADPLQFDQILMNLTANARDAMPQGGTLTIETRNLVVVTQGKNADAEVPPGSYVMLTVADTGAGMSQETQQHIFEPYFTTKAQGRGTGLGLATVYGIVKQNGGWIFVQSEPTQGTTFRIYLPSISGFGAAAKVPGPLVVSECSESLLVVEDEEDVRNFAVEVLKSRGYCMLSAGDAESALALAESSADPLHLLVTDVVLPGMNGRDLAERLKAIRPNMKVLFTSGYTRDVLAEHGILEPGTDYLAKPYTPGELTARVKDLLSRTPGIPA